MRLLQFSRCREVEEFRICLEDKENRTWLGQMGRKGGIEDTVHVWLTRPSCLEPFTMKMYVGGTCFLMGSHLHIKGPPLKQASALSSVCPLWGRRSDLPNWCI